MLKSILVAICMMGVSGIASASTYTGQIVYLGIDEGIGDVLFVRTAASFTGAPSCSTNAFNFAVSLSTSSGQQLMAMLLAARAALTTVTIVGTGTCSVYGNVETLATITY